MNKGLIFALIAAASGAVNADPRDGALVAMQRCSALPDRDKRLSCYDAAIARAPVDVTPMHPVSALPGGSGPVATFGVLPAHH